MKTRCIFLAKKTKSRSAYPKGRIAGSRMDVFTSGCRFSGIAWIMLACFFIQTSLSASTFAQRKKSIYHKGWIDFNKNGQKDVYEDVSQPIDARVEDLLKQMTLEEKSCQLATLYGYGRVLKDSLPTPKWDTEIWKDGIANIDEQLNGVGRGYKRAYNLIYPFSNHVAALHETQRWFVEKTRLGIPVEFSNEGIHGLNHTLATPLPAPIALGSTWNKSLIYEAGDIVGHEGSLLGYHSIYAPILDVARDQRWGRTLECYSEDPFLVAELGKQMVLGIQKWGITAGLKHYAAYGVPKGGRDGNCRTDPHINPRELHEIFLYPFKRVIQEAQPLEVMSSYNDWNGEPVSSSYYFLTELLRDEYGFKGYVVSDSEAVEFVYTKHQVADSYADAVRQVLEAGLNVRTHFTHPKDFILPIRQLVKEGKLSMAVVDERVRQVLKVKFRLGLFDNPYTGDLKQVDKLVGADKQTEFVQKVGEQSIVLLKNENNLLPLQKERLKRILVTGPLADESNFMASRYGPNGLPAVTMLKGLRDYLAGSVEVDYEKGCNIVDKHWPTSEIIPYPLDEQEVADMQKGVKKAENADVIIAVMGEDEYRTGESRSRTSLELPGRQRQYLMELYKTGKPVILVLINGQPLTINWENAFLPAIVETWFPNCLGGKVLAETLFGENNPSGKLSVTFPKTTGQIEFNFPFKKGSHNYQSKKGPNGFGLTRVEDELYPFGYGLSYTTFAYSDLKIVKHTDNTVDVEATITNTGSRKGTEVVQLYLRDEVSSVVTYDSQLRGFERVTLLPGESRTVHFKLTDRDMQLLDKQMKWTVEPGTFEVRVGASSKDIRLKGKFII